MVFLKDLVANGRSFNYNGENITEKKTFDFEKPLSTRKSLSKQELIEYLQKADIPDDADFTLSFDDGVFYLFFYWSESAGAFGHRAVNFDLETPDLVRDFEAWKNNKP